MSQSTTATSSPIQRRMLSTILLAMTLIVLWTAVSNINNSHGRILDQMDDDYYQDDEIGEELAAEVAEDEPAAEFPLKPMIVYSKAGNEIVESKDLSSLYPSSSITENEDVKSDVTFVYYMGIEGTGHHYVNGLQRSAPSTKAINDKMFKLITRLGRALFNWVDKEHGLWTLPCAKHLPKDDPSSDKVENPYKKVIGLMKEIEETWKRENDTPTPIHIPLNCGRGEELLSYPAHTGECRALQYADIDLLYAACDEAGVKCKSVVMVRDAYEVIRSTVDHRHFTAKQRQIKLLTTMLDVMHTQVFANPDRLMTVYNYGDAEPNFVLGKILGYTEDEFKEVFQNSFDASKAEISEDEKREIIPNVLSPYIDVMVRSTERLKILCDHILKQQV